MIGRTQALAGLLVRCARGVQLYQQARTNLRSCDSIPRHICSVSRSASAEAPVVVTVASVFMIPPLRAPAAGAPLY